MKKFIYLAMFFSLLYCTNIMEVSSKDVVEVDKFVKDMSEIFPEFENIDELKQIEVFNLNDTLFGSVFITIRGNIQTGFIVYSDIEGIVQVSFSSTDVIPQEFTKLYYQFPSNFFNETDRENIFNSAEEITISKTYFTGEGYYYTNLTWNWWLQLTGYDENIFQYNLSSGIPLLSSNVTTMGSSYHTQTYIMNVPDYLNIDDISCVPTSTAMMMAYYDNEYRDSWSSFDIGDYPLTAESSGGYESEAEDLIRHFRTIMKTDKKYGEDGSSAVEWSYGLSKHFDDETLYAYYDAVVSSINDLSSVTPNEYTNYKTLINKGNPTVLFLLVASGSPYQVNHAVTGIGYFTNMTMGNGVVVYDNNIHGMTLIKDDYIDFFGFIYND